MPARPRTSARSLARAALAAAVGALLCAPGASASASRAWAGGVATVGYRSAPALRGALRREPATVVRVLPALRVAEVRPRGDVERFARALRRQPGIRYVEPPAQRESTAEPAVVADAADGQPYEWQWAATHEDAVPDPVLRAASAVTVAVVDTGADLTAPDLAAKSPIAHSVTGSDTVTDPVGHGTFVSALAAGSVTNGEGISGFGGDARLMVVQASTGRGVFTDVDEANAIVWAVDNGARIVNLSLAGTDTSTTEQGAIAYAASHGVLLVAAAGNDHGNGDPVEYPAALLQPVGSNGQGGIGLAVGASTRDGSRAGFSNVGSYLSLAAPGDAVFSALPAGIGDGFLPLALPGSSAGTYGLGSGTSFAAPQVAGAAALVWAANPLLTAAQVADVLKQSASGHGAWSPELGFGVIDVAAAVARASGDRFVRPAVTLTGRRQPAGTAQLTWSGTAVSSFRVSVSEDGGAPRVLVASTTDTTATFPLRFGHSYAFTVAALDAAGAQAAVSAPYTVELARARARLTLAATRLAVTATLRLAKPGPAASGRTIVLESLEQGAWRTVSRAVTTRGGVVRWHLTLAAGAHRLRARFRGADDVQAAASPPVAVRIP